MSRIVQRNKLNADGKPVNRFGGWSERVVKYVPAEVLGFYLPLNAMIDAAGPAEANVKFGAYVFIFVVGLVSTPAFLFKVAKPERPPTKQLLMSTIAFVLWAYYLGGMFTVLGLHDNLIAAIALGTFTLLAGLVEP